MMTTDILLVILSLWLAFALRLSTLFWPHQNQIGMFILAPVLSLLIFIQFGLYREVVRYIGQRGFLMIAQATGVLVLSWFFVTLTFLPIYLDIGLREFIGNWFPRSIPLLFQMNLLLTIGGSRLVARWILSGSNVPPTGQAKRKVLIYGANRVGSELALSLYQNKDIQVLGFIDDDLSLKGHFIQDLKVLGDRTEIEKIRENVSPLEVLLAIPKMQPQFRKGLLKYLENKNVIVRTIPSLNEITNREVIINDLLDIDINDLLAREPRKPIQSLLTTCVTRKSVLVTGAGGSIGSELCRQIILLAPKCIILFDHSEHNLYQINLELLTECEKNNSDIKIIPILGSVIDKQRVEETIKLFQIDTIYHAAAYKHVTLIENNIREGILNNIFGTYTVAEAALNLNVKSFILISTDKAVRPTSIMGATKRISELVALGLSERSTSQSSDSKFSTRFIVVRFGNVLGSSGSVIPLFKKQIVSGGPITITHPEVTRYFMTIPEASQLVIQAGSIGGDRNIFVLDMGKPVLILSLAKRLVYLSGHILKSKENSQDSLGIEIKYTGLKKGEKIHEELFIGENITSTEHPMIMKAQDGFCEWSEVKNILADLKHSLKNNDNESLHQKLMQYAMKNASVKST